MFIICMCKHASIISVSKVFMRPLKTTCVFELLYTVIACKWSILCLFYELIFRDFFSLFFFLFLCFCVVNSNGCTVIVLQQDHKGIDLLGLLLASIHFMSIVASTLPGDHLIQRMMDILLLRYFISCFILQYRPRLLFLMENAVFLYPSCILMTSFTCELKIPQPIELICCC